jgi:crossover junction endodeoxyribonuclease RuvC
VRYIGIDPGIFGAIAELREDGDPTWIPMPTVKAGSKRAIDGAAVRDFLCVDDDRPLVAIEKVGAMPKQGVTSSFNFGAGWGKIQGVCDGLRVSYVLVQPQAWKKKILEGLGGDKSATIRYCMMRWPALSLVAPRCRTAHDGAADALCLALFAKLCV